MGSAVKPAKSHAKVSQQPNRPRKFASPIDKAKAFEVAWNQVAGLFEATRHLQGAVFVYFIGEPDDGPLKIGLSKDPVGRLRTMQTGNPRRLRIEYVLLGGAHTEKVLHELWEAHAVFSARTTGRVGAAPGTEWFNPDARGRLLPIIATAAKKQIAYLNDNADDVTPDQMERLIREAHVEHDFELKGREMTRFLGAGGGIALQGRVSRV